MKNERISQKRVITNKETQQYLYANATMFIRKGK